jgi:hypothetical protein
MRRPKNYRDYIIQNKAVGSFLPNLAQDSNYQKLERQYRYLIEGHYKIIYSYDRKNQVSFIHTIFDTRFNPEKLKL